ncbi:hypothetical protein CF319_g9282 [Tilletia indica]|nr:hypothetical protein CF319_g9282 [Tilletia indica]
MRPKRSTSLLRLLGNALDLARSGQYTSFGRLNPQPLHPIPISATLLPDPVTCARDHSVLPNVASSSIHCLQANNNKTYMLKHAYSHIRPAPTTTNVLYRTKSTQTGSLCCVSQSFSPLPQESLSLPSEHMSRSFSKQQQQHHTLSYKHAPHIHMHVQHPQAPMHTTISYQVHTRRHDQDPASTPTALGGPPRSVHLSVEVGITFASFLLSWLLLFMLTDFIATLPAAITQSSISLCSP